MEQYIKIKCGKLYDGLKPCLQENVEILICDKHIKEVGHNLACPADTKVIDISHLTVTPGLIDAHVHTAFFDWRQLYRDIIYNSPGYRTLGSYYTAQKALYGGFTTIRAVGWFSEAYELDVKKAINEGYLPGARMVVAGHVIGTSGGHGDLSQGFKTNPELADHLESIYPGIGNGPEFFAAAVRREKKLGSDFIKIMATGGFATPTDGPEDIQLSDAEMEALFDTAHKVHIPTTAHVYGPELMQKLIHYGISGCEHGSLMDNETAKLFEDTGTYLVPTFTPYQDIVEGNEERMSCLPYEYNKKLHEYRDRLVRGREIILASNIKLGYGTDLIIVRDNYINGREYYCWLKSGADPFRALQAATKNNAEICGVEKITGTIEAGKFADISGWQRDLLKDPNALLDCSFVMKEGAVYQTECRLEKE
ncbi:MAG: amidohydrolase family protein [bacterium]|nr:amidohydrolase family protein [bacterium]